MGGHGLYYSALANVRGSCHSASGLGESYLSFVNTRQSIFYVGKDLQVQIGHTPYTLDFWNSSFNAEFTSRSRAQRMSVFRASNQIQDFTPATARLVFPNEALGSLDQMLLHPTPALPLGEDAQPQDAPQYEEEPMDL